MTTGPKGTRPTPTLRVADPGLIATPAAIAEDGARPERLTPWIMRISASTHAFLVLLCTGHSAAEDISLGRAAEFWLARAEDAVAKEDWETANRELRKCMLAGRREPRADHLHAYVLYRNGQFAEAARKYHQLRGDHPRSFAPAYQYALCLYRMKHYAQAVAAFKMGLALILGKESLRAAEHLTNAGERDPGSELAPAARYWAGDAYVKAGKYRRAYESFSKCIRAFPETKWAKFSKGRLTLNVFDDFRGDR